MSFGWILLVLVLLPVLLSAVSLLKWSATAVIRFCAIGTICVAGVGLLAAYHVFHSGTLFAVKSWFMLDALSAYHLVVMMIVFSMSALYGLFYWSEEIESGSFTRRAARRYSAMWFGSLAAMALVLVSNNLGIMWVGVEATTLLTAFLICIQRSSKSLEAMWKYLLMCSVGVALAFIGTLLVVASAKDAHIIASEVLLWTALREVASNLNPTMMKAGFIFMVVGYGTKAGLAPMHNWLPDAHSQAPSPVSAVFSGFLLNAALYCIIRCLPLVEAATGNAGWGRDILIVFGALSIMVAAGFIVAQHDVKRFLAYSSVEHLGLMALGIGVGGYGALAALLHMLNHSIGKPLSFFCAGKLGQQYGTHDMRLMTRVLKASPVWGTGLIVGLLALIGVAPFGFFLSEFLIMKSAIDAGLYWTAAIFITGIGVVFVAALRHIISMAWQPSGNSVPIERSRIAEGLLVFLPLAILLLLGVWLPQPLLNILKHAAQILSGGAL